MKLFYLADEVNKSTITIEDIFEKSSFIEDIFTEIDFANYDLTGTAKIELDSILDFSFLVFDFLNKI